MLFDIKTSPLTPYYHYLTILFIHLVSVCLYETRVQHCTFCALALCTNFLSSTIKSEHHGATPHTASRMDGRLRCTVDIRIMVGHYARDEIFVFCCHFTRSGSLRLADWSLLISFYVSRQSQLCGENLTLCVVQRQSAYSQLSAPPV